MDTMLTISTLALIAFIITTGFNLINSGYKRLVLRSFLVLFLVSGAITGCTTTNQPTSEAAAAQSSLSQVSQTASTPPSENQNSAGNKDITTSVPGGTVKVSFIDVGQADSILIQLPSGQNMLIDAGNNDDGDQVVSYIKNAGVKKLDHVIGTHPHEDHIGGLDVAVKSFDTGKVYLPKVSHNTKTYEDLLLAIKNKGLKVTEAKGGVKLDVGAGATAELLAPNGTGYDELNNYSAVLKLTFGNTSFLFTGDAEDISENQMLSAGYNLKVDVLKVGHHGSSSSTTAAFLKAVSPKYAVICVGKDNDYGHPHSETLSKLATAGVEVYRTDQQGTIIATSDGKTVTFNTEPTTGKVSPINTGSVNPKPMQQVSKQPSGTPPSTVTTSGVVISNIDLKAELVTIKNNATTVNLSGWKLVSEKGNQEFTFPSGTTLAAGATIKIVTGPNAAAGSGVLLWTTKNIWNNDGDPGALYDSSGNLISRYPR